MRLDSPIPLGTMFDPATTRSIGNGQYVRDPFPGNIIPPNRLDPNAVKLLELMPGPNPGRACYNNYNVNRNSTTDVNSFDVRMDQNFSSKDQMFGAYSWSKSPSFFPGPFTGFADGGGFGAGRSERRYTRALPLSYTHSFTPTLLNEARVGFNREHTSRVQPFGNDTTNIPAQFGIQGIPQTPGNGGLPNLAIGGLSQLGSSEWLISDRYSNTIQFTENLNKVYRLAHLQGRLRGAVDLLPLGSAALFARRIRFQRPVHFHSSIKRIAAPAARSFFSRQRRPVPAESLGRREHCQRIEFRRCGRQPLLLRRVLSG